MKNLLISFAGIFCIFTSVSRALGAEIPPAETAGRKIYIDPAKGQKSSPPAFDPALALAPGLTNRVSTATDGLKELPVTAQPGGFKVHLRGRFQSTLAVTNGPGARPSIQCVTQPAQASSTSSNVVNQDAKSAR